MKVTYVDDIATYGFAVLENVVDSETVCALLQAVANANTDNIERIGKIVSRRMR